MPSTVRQAVPRVIVSTARSRDTSYGRTWRASRPNPEPGLFCAHRTWRSPGPARHAAGV